MDCNSFGRKIKDNFSLTFKKEEEEMKLFLNEQVVPSAYLKQLILEDMKKGNKAHVMNATASENNNNDNYKEELVEEKPKNKVGKLKNPNK